MCLAPSYTWTLKGTVHQHRVRSRWGSAGRINLIGTLCLKEETERLEYSLLGGSCHSSGEVKSYLDALAEKAEREGKPCVVVLDNAPNHTSGMIREREEQWEAKGLRL